MRQDRAKHTKRRCLTRLSRTSYRGAVTVFVNIHEAKTHLSRLLEQVAAGERVIISKAGTPIAELVPHRRQPVIIGGLKGKITYSDADWESADAEIAEMFYRSDASS